jgi:hypothetical protein
VGSTNGPGSAGDDLLGKRGARLEKADDLGEGIGHFGLVAMIFGLRLVVRPKGRA